MKCDIFLMILNSKKHEGQVPELELALLFQISLLLYSVFASFLPHTPFQGVLLLGAFGPCPYLKTWVMNS